MLAVNLTKTSLPKRYLAFTNKFYFDPSDGIIHVTTSKNNTLLTLTDMFGDVLSWTTCRNCGFAGGQKSTARATVTTVEERGLRTFDLQRKSVIVIFNGSRKLRGSVTRGLARSKVVINSFIVKPVIPYNGCRNKKPRRK